MMMMKACKPLVGVNGTKRIFVGLVFAVAVMFPRHDAAAVQAPVQLGSAGNFAVLAGSTVTSTGGYDGCRRPGCLDGFCNDRLRGNSAGWSRNCEWDDARGGCGRTNSPR